MRSPTNTPTPATGATDHCDCGGSTESHVSPPPSPVSTNSPRSHFHIANMDCASEEAEIRRAVDGLPGVKGLTFNLAARQLTIAAEPSDLQVALEAIHRVGFKPVAVEFQVPTRSDAPAQGAWGQFWRDWGSLIAALMLALMSEGLAFFLPDTFLAKLAGMALAVFAVALSGFSVYGKGLTALRQGRLNISALMTVAVTGAFLIGQWPEAAMVMALYAIAEAIEARAVDRARNAIKGLMALAPEETEQRQSDGSWRKVLVATVPVGALVRIRPGERVPLDGIVTRGHSAVDQSPVTGESLPIDKAPGDDVFSGTINQAAELEVEVSAPASESTLARIIHAVEEAQQSRAPTQRFVDQFSAIYTPAIFLLAVGIALLAPSLLGWSWMDAVYKALVLLVIACPCALVISTPVTVVSALAAAARRGILIKGGVYLEEARKLRTIALDKTGTITEGKPKLVAIEPLGTNPEGLTIESIAKSLAHRSDHPVSKAIADGLAQQQPQEVHAFQAKAGRGTEGEINGIPYVLANHRWIQERGQSSPELEARLKTHEEAGRTVTLLANAAEVMAILAVADTIKKSSASAIADLKKLGVTAVMLSGDNNATARSVATQAGIDEVRAELLPEEKLQAIDQLQRRDGLVAMVGDGINDAPALAKAHIGFAMGGAGTHVAMEAADIVVMNDDLRRLPETIELSRKAHVVLWQNISLALGIKLVFLLLALAGQASMWMAVFADMGASLLVVFNGLRMLKGSRFKE